MLSDKLVGTYEYCEFKKAKFKQMGAQRSESTASKFRVLSLIYVKLNLCKLGRLNHFCATPPNCVIQHEETETSSVKSITAHGSRRTA